MAGKVMRIRGMTCDHCERTVAEALTGAGARDVTADWRAGQAQFDATTGDQQLAAAVETDDYDLVVLGSGSAAFAAAITATEAGARVARAGEGRSGDHGRRRSERRRLPAHDQPEDLGSG